MHCRSTPSFCTCSLGVEREREKKERTKILLLLFMFIQIIIKSKEKIIKEVFFCYYNILEKTKTHKKEKNESIKRGMSGRKKN